MWSYAKLYFFLFILVTRQERTKKRAKGVPLDSLRNLRFDAEVGGFVSLNETSDRQKSGGRIAEGKRTYYFN